MSYKRVTIITGSAVTDEAIAIIKTKYMPAVRAMGCLEADVIQTGPDSTLLIATYADKAAADAAAEKAAALRAESQEEFKGNAPTILEGKVIVTM
jgi:quinol monooxygenase YgiN